MNEDKLQPLTPPIRDKKRAVIRSVFEAFVQCIPWVGGFIVHLYLTTHPPQDERKRESWEADASNLINKHDSQLDQHEAALTPPMENITGVAALLLSALAKDCPDGMCGKRYDLDGLCSLVPDTDRQELENAISDMAAIGLISVNRFIGGWHVRLDESFYEKVDHQIMGWDTVKDAAVLAQRMLDDEGTAANAPALHETTGWEKRRFNPALAYLERFIPKGRNRKVIQPDYPTYGFSLIPQDRAVLRRFIRDVDTLS